MHSLTKIKEQVVDIPQNQNLVTALYPMAKPGIDKCEFAYLAYINGNKKLPVQGLFSDDIALLRNRLGFKKELEIFLTRNSNPTFVDILFFLEAYKNHKTYGVILSTIYGLPRFENSPILGDILKDTYGYIVWHYQLESLIRIFSNIPDTAREIRKGLNRQDPGCWELIKKFTFVDSSTLFDVYNERKMAPVTSNPQYLEAYNLFNLITGGKDGVE